jgi:hypothetical protein
VTTLEREQALAPITVPAWTWLVVVLALAVVWALTLENGMVLAKSAGTLHEFFHDARHFVGVPCH